MTMPFGRHKGRALEDLPGDYLAWLVSLHLRDPLRSRVAEEFARRQAQGPDPRLVEDLIAAGQRALARRYHPDAGGSHEHMLAVRAAADWLFGYAARLRGIAA